MLELKDFGPLGVTGTRQGHRVPVATHLMIGEITFAAPADPRLLLVPANIVSLQQMWDALRMPSRNNLLVTGESGSGKTAFVRYLGRVYQEALYTLARDEQDPAVAVHINARASAFQARILTFHENLRRSDITERRHYGESGEEKTGWTMSDVMDGMVAGDWNVLSEINRTGEDVQAEFNEPLENKAKSLHQQVIRGHPDSRFIATVNPVKGEGRGIYEGRVMSGEFMNRFTNKVHLKYLPPDQEFEVLKDYGPGVDDGTIDRLVMLATDIRRDYAEEHGVVPFPVTTRSLIRMVRHLEAFPQDADELRSLFWRKAYWLDDRIHPPIARKLVEDLLDLHNIVDLPRKAREGSRTIEKSGKAGFSLQIGDVSHPLGPGGPYVPDTVIEEVQQNLADLEWILKDIALHENILLIGEAGVGKNKLESYLAHLLQWNLLVIGMSGETRVSDLLTYRSFGEEEAGKTGDTATLGLHALTDPDHQWIIVLDEANKANPGVLVSFNDLLQDRLVRLPGGREAAVRAAICVNINPNRPPYEVNDFSFEFMDRFSIHTILHLPADQAIEVLKRKYPEADIDFVRDVVNGYYALHPLYSGGVLFEPITMRNEEAAIERGLQYPEQGCNLIDLICSGYSPRDVREQNAIRNTLQSQGFDRNMLSSARSLDRFRESWESDKKNEKRAFALAETYRRIGKPSAARAILNEMLHVHPGRDWACHLVSAFIFLDDGQDADALREVQAGFAEGTTVRMENRAEYLVLHADTRIREGNLRLSLEVLDIRTGHQGFVCSTPARPPAETIHRLSGEYRHIYTDTGHGLTVYERISGTVSGHENRSGDASQAIPDGCPGLPPEENETSVQDLVTEMVRLIGISPEFSRQICLYGTPPWDGPARHDRDIAREIVAADGWRARGVSSPGRGWSVEYSGKEPALRDTRGVRIGWLGGSDQQPGYLLAGDEKGTSCRIPGVSDPFRGLAYDEREPGMYLVLRDDAARAVRESNACFSGAFRETSLMVLSPQEYHARILSPRLSVLRFRLMQLFRYARPLAGYKALGTGDVVYTVRPGSRVSVSVLVDVDGMGPVFGDISSMDVEHIFIPPRQVDAEGEADPLLARMVIPFSGLCECDEWRLKGESPGTMSFLENIRRYVASVFFDKTQARDFGFEGKSCAFLSHSGLAAEPVRQENPSLCRGDILVRAGTDPAASDWARSVFIVRFLQDNGKTIDDPPLIRGFWLGEQNSVGTLRLEEVAGRFNRLLVDSDDKYLRIIRNLAAACPSLVRPWKVCRTGTWSAPVVHCSCGGLEITFHASERRFQVTVPSGEDGKHLVIEETGFPAMTTIVYSGKGEETQWPGTPIADIQYDTDRDLAVLVLGDELLDHLVGSRGLKKMIPVGEGRARVMIVSRSEAEAGGIIPVARHE